jgi:hypothetical protein
MSNAKEYLEKPPNQLKRNPLVLGLGSDYWPPEWAIGRRCLPHELCEHTTLAKKNFDKITPPRGFAGVKSFWDSRDDQTFLEV